MSSSQRQPTGLSFWIGQNVPENRLTFIKRSHIKDYVRPTGYVQKIIYNLYQCSCGKKTSVRRGLAGVHIFSCGCLRRETRIRMNAEGNRGPGGCRPKNGVRAPAHNKGKVYVKDNPSGEKYVTQSVMMRCITGQREKFTLCGSGKRLIRARNSSMGNMYD